MEELTKTAVEQISSANPYSPVVYSLILILLTAISGLFIWLYLRSLKDNQKLILKSLELAELMGTIRLRLEDQRSADITSNGKLDKIIELIGQINVKH